MKKRLTKGEKWLFASPVLLLGLTVGAVEWRKNLPISFEINDSALMDSLEFSPDGRRLVAITEHNPTSYRLGRLYDLESRAKVCDLEMPKPPSQLLYYGWPSWSPDGKTIVSGAGKVQRIAESIVFWDAESGMVKAEFPNETPVQDWGTNYIRYAPDGKTLIGGGIPPARYDLNTGKRLNQPDKKIDQELQFANNEKLGLTARGRDGGSGLAVVDNKTGQMVWSLSRNYGTYGWDDDVLGVIVRFREANKYKSTREELWFWDAKTRQILPPVSAPSGSNLHGFNFKSDQKTVVYHSSRAISEEPEVYITELVAYDYRASRVLWRRELRNLIVKVDWSPDGRWLVAVGFEEGSELQLLVYDQHGNLQLERKPVGHITSWSPDSRRLAYNTFERRENLVNPIHNRVEIHRFED